MEKTLTVKRHTYRRTIKPREVTFVCKSHPGGPKEITEDRLPGATPAYCLACIDAGRRRDYKAKAALMRYYERKQKELQTT